MVFKATLDVTTEQHTRHELERARDIEERLSMRRLPLIKGLDYYGECRHGKDVGGDFFDFVATEDEGLVFSIGDTSVKGVSGAILTTGMRSYVRALAASGFVQMARLAEKLNRMIWELAPADFYARVFCGKVDGSRRLLQYVNAGQEAALLVRTRAGRVARLENNGTVFGLSSHAIYSQRSVHVEEGDLLVAFTNGVAEAGGSGSSVVMERLVIDTIRDYPRRAPNELTGRILSAVEEFTGRADVEDDRTVVVIRFVGTAAEKDPDRAVRELALAEAA